ncbi:MAG TPA: ROK family protein, partial [Candidatus Limnocylindria bacterium]|nr:ROK family protein [Candidatus Limnocylindria bacterium]
MLAEDRAPVLAIDLGGTLIRVAHLGPDLTVAHREVIPTMPTVGVEGVLERMISTARSVLAAAEAAGLPAPAAVGVASPGPLDPQRGVVHQPPNLPGWDEVPLAHR